MFCSKIQQKSWSVLLGTMMLCCFAFGDMVQRRRPPLGGHTIRNHALFQQHFRMRAGNFYDLDLDIIHRTICIHIYSYIDINKYTNKCMYIKCKHIFSKMYIEFIQDDPRIFPNVFPIVSLYLESAPSTMGHSPLFSS